MNRQSWSFEVFLLILRRMRRSVSSSLSMALMIGLKLHKNSRKNILLEIAQVNNVGRDGTTTLILQLIKNLGGLSKNYNYFNFIRFMVIVGRTSLNILLGGKLKHI